MTPEIRTIDPMPVLRVRRTGTYGQAAEEAFAALMAFAGRRGLLGPDTRMIGLPHDDATAAAAGGARFDACIPVPAAVTGNEEVQRDTIAGGRYAVFLHRGPYDAFQRTYEVITRDWLPSSGERVRDVPWMEVYLDSPDRVAPADLRTEIWVPLA